jgi:hypothetical protein
MVNKYLQRKASKHPPCSYTQCTHVLVLRAPEPPSPKGKLHWGVGPPHPSQATHGIRDVWAYRLEAASLAKRTKSIQVTCVIIVRK